MVHYRRDFRLIVDVFVVLLITVILIHIAQKACDEKLVLSASQLQFKSGTVLVRFKQAVGRHEIDTALRQVKAVQSGTVYGSDVIILKVAKGQEREICQRLSKEPGVLYAEPDFLYSIASSPDDPFFGSQWAHTKLQSSQAWDIITGSTAIKIAIIDSGIDAAHPDLADKILPGQSFLNQGQQNVNSFDQHGHGTHVAGIAAAVTNNNAGVAGMSWGAKIIPVRVLDAQGDGWTTDIAAGINWARTQGADIINLSIGGEAESATMQVATQAAYDAGILVVGAMGNYNPEIPYYPAAYPHVLAVAATDINNQHPPYSKYGTHTDIAAPGGTMAFVHDSNGIFSTMPTYPVYLTTEEQYSTYYDMMHGTSQAAPFISGLAALIWSMDESLSPDEISTVITSTAVDLGESGWDQYYGHGLADAKAALDNINRLETTPTLYDIENSDQDGNYIVQWEAVERAINYQLEVSADSGFSHSSVVYSGAGTEYHIVGQSAGRWYYRVQASNASGVSPWSQIVETGVLPEPPVLLPIVSGSEPDAYTVSWSVVTGGKGYVLQQAADISFTQPVTRYMGSDLQHYISGQPGGVWSYRVKAYNNVGSGAWSNIHSKTVPMPSLDAPELLPIDNVDGDGDYVVQWTIVPSTTVYALEISNNPYFHTSSIAYVGPYTTALSIINQENGTWYYRVRGYSATANSPWSAIQKVIVISQVYVPYVVKQYTAPLPTSYISNGDFEAGDAAWTQYSLKEYPLIVNKSFAGMKIPHGGDWAVWMGGVYGEIAYIQQEVLIYPSTPYLSYWHWIDSSETNCDKDTASVIVNTDVADHYGLCQNSNTAGWIQHTVDLNAYTGGKATLVLRVTTDNDLNSNYFIDDIIFATSPILISRDKPVFSLTTSPVLKP